MRWGIRFTLESRSTTRGSEGCRCLGKAEVMGSCNYSHKLNGRAEDGVSGRIERAGRRGRKGERVSGGRKEEWEGEKLRKRSSQWVAFLSFFFLVLSLVGVHHVTLCNWPVVTPELYKQISRETCQPEGLRRWMCVLCELQMWDCVGNGLME